MQDFGGRIMAKKKEKKEELIPQTLRVWESGDRCSIQK
jgi:hypothetical protein